MAAAVFFITGRPRKIFVGHAPDLMRLLKLSGPGCMILLLQLIAMKPDRVELVFTGRYAAPELIAAADLVTEMKENSNIQ